MWFGYNLQIKFGQIVNFVIFCLFGICEMGLLCAQLLVLFLIYIIIFNVVFIFSV